MQQKFVVGFDPRDTPYSFIWALQGCSLEKFQNSWTTLNIPGIIFFVNFILDPSSPWKTQKYILEEIRIWVKTVR